MRQMQGLFPRTIRKTARLGNAPYKRFDKRMDARQAHSGMTKETIKNVIPAIFWRESRTIMGPPACAGLRRQEHSGMTKDRKEGSFYVV